MNIKLKNNYDIRALASSLSNAKGPQLETALNILKQMHSQLSNKDLQNYIKTIIEYDLLPRTKQNNFSAAATKSCKTVIKKLKRYNTEVSS
ncbi:MAG: hypothetical protein R6U96_14640 [Promethearchaeia archaeon]